MKKNTQKESFEWTGSHWRPKQRGLLQEAQQGTIISAAFQTTAVYSLSWEHTPSTEHSGCLSKGCTEAMEEVSW